MGAFTHAKRGRYFIDKYSTTAAGDRTGDCVCHGYIVNAKHHLKGAFTVIELLIMRSISEC